MRLKRFTAGALALSILATLPTAALASGSAASEDTAGYLILGEDLSDSQEKTVLKLLDVDDLSDYEVSYTTHEEEEELFGSYLSASLLGTKALSSILLIPAEEGSGITVTTYNISYCTEEMYQTALADAGVADVEVHVAAPTSLSGTCALASAFKAYTIMTGEELDEDATDAAAEEIVTTGEVGEAIGDTDTATKLIAVLKEKALSEGLDEDEIGDTLDQLCENMEVTLDDETRQKIIDLIVKLQNADIDLDTIKQQASDLYDSIKSELEKLDESGATEGSSNAFTALIQSIVDFFKSLFGNLFG
ncbi:MAG: DUF1002 domain-containing protein [Clostridiales bacterium]|nr:DUF1002 domain-containing protein [Clostridiales bacterium]